MAQINAAAKEINAKIVYYGPGRSGKTTNIQYVHAKLKPEHKGELMTLSTEQDRTLFFDFLPVDLGDVRGLKTRFHLYTVPGQIFYNSTRKLVLKNTDGVVFVADSEAKYLNENIESFKNLVENLKVHGRDPTSIPIVIQYNKRDREDALTIAQLNKAINSYNLPIVEAVASRGQGVLQTLTLITKMVMKELSNAGAAAGGNRPMFAGTPSASVSAPPLESRAPIAPPPPPPAAPAAEEEVIDSPAMPDITPVEQIPTNADPSGKSLESWLHEDESEEDAALGSLGTGSDPAPAPSAAAATSLEEDLEVEIEFSGESDAANARAARQSAPSTNGEVRKRLEMVGLNAVEKRGELEIILEVELRDPETGQLYTAPLQLTLGGAYIPK